MECGGTTRRAPVGDTMPSPRRTTVDVADVEVAARGENSMPAARGGNRMPKIPDAADEIEVPCAAKRNLEELQLQITHLPHMPTR